MAVTSWPPLWRDRAVVVVVVGGVADSAVLVPGDPDGGAAWLVYWLWAEKPDLTEDELPAA